MNNRKKEKIFYEYYGSASPWIIYTNRILTISYPIISTIFLIFSIIVAVISYGLLWFLLIPTIISVVLSVIYLIYIGQRLWNVVDLSIGLFITMLVIFISWEFASYFSMINLVIFPIFFLITLISLVFIGILEGIILISYLLALIFSRKELISLKKSNNKPKVQKVSKPNKNKKKSFSLEI